MKELILVRHGLAQHLVRGFTGGWTDLPLTELGRQQSVRTGARLSKLLLGLVVELYSSDFHRARETAEILGETLSLQPVLVPSLRDVNNGIAANRLRAEAEKDRLPMTQPLMDWIPFPEAESWRMMMERATGFLTRLKGRDVDAVILVTHRNVISAIIQWWLQLTDELISTTDFESDPCSLSRLTISYWGGRTVIKLNDTAHLGEDQPVLPSLG
jgi:probable phosphoglycerate mutase